MFDSQILPVSYVVVAGSIVYWMRVRRYPQRERRLLLLSLFLHLAATGVLIAITSTRYGIGDMFGYARRGVVIADAISSDLGMGLENLWGMATGADLAPPFSRYGNQASAAFQAAVGGVLYLTGGSFIASSLVFTFLSSFGVTSLYEGLRRHLPPPMYIPLILGLFFLPAYLIWASGLVKEAAGVALLGVGIGRILQFAKDPHPVNAAIAAVATLALAALRPHLVAAFAIGIAIWMIARGRDRNQRAKRTALALAAGALFFVLAAPFLIAELGELSEDFGSLQAAALDNPGGSTITWGELGSTTIAGQVASLPGGLVNVWTRPWPTDINSIVSAGSSVQMLTLLAIGVTALRRRPLLSSYRLLIRYPALLLLLIVGISSSVAVALGSTNLGSIDRYRAPALLLVAPVLLLLAAGNSDGVIVARPKLAVTPEHANVEIRTT